MVEEIKKAFEKVIEILQQHCDNQTCEKIAYACIDNILDEVNTIIQSTKKENQNAPIPKV